MRKTPLMLEIEDDFHRDIADMLIEYRYGARPKTYEEIADMWGVTVATIARWCSEAELGWKQLAHKYMSESRVEVTRAMHERAG